MAAPAGRPLRPRGTNASQLPILAGRVRPDLHAKAHRHAAVLNITLASYLERLIDGAPEPDVEGSLLPMETAS